MVLFKVKHLWIKWIFPLTGFLSLLWFLLRVLPKPNRAAYPCQRAAAPMATGFVLWLLGATGSAMMCRKAGIHLRRSRYIMGIICFIAGVGFAWCALSGWWERRSLAVDPIPNTPIGIARGIHPGRVVWIHDPLATDWRGPGAGDGYSWEPNHTNQSYVHDMLSRAIRELAGQTGDFESWDTLFRHFNQNKGRGDRGYQSGEKITIKINLTTCNLTLSHVDPATGEKTKYLDKSDTSPQMIVALLRQLVHVVGVDPCDIAVGDTLAWFPRQWWDLCRAEFPRVHYFDRVGKLGRVEAQPSSIVQYWSHGQSVGYHTDYIPRCYAEADYLINLAVLKGHSAGVTLCAKNHYGSYARTPNQANYYDLHESLAGSENDPGCYRALVDIMGHAHMGGKTLLYLIDGLYGGYYWHGTPYKFQMPPFNNDWPSSLLASQDPVAIDSVGLDFLWEEWPHVTRITGVDDYLHEAALAHDPYSRTFYDPDGIGLGLPSLGVHEHWNNPVDKQYSRNLGAGNGIELLCHRLTNHSPLVEANAAENVIFLNHTLAVSGTVTDNDLPDPCGVITLAWSRTRGPGPVHFIDPQALTTIAAFTQAGRYTLRLTADDGELNACDEITVTVYYPGDFDTDGDVDLLDLATFTAHWCESDCTETDWCDWADIDRNTSVDLNDFFLLCDYWLRDWTD